MLKRWCWNWQTGMVEGHVPLGRAGSTPAQRTIKTAHIPKVGVFLFCALYGVIVP